MKLINKRTGKIGYLYEHSLMQDMIIVYDVKGIISKYTSLAELNEEWEDYEEEEKEYYTLNSSGQIWTTECFNEESIKNMKQIGNYFNTREEAEKAVERLKKLQNLRNRGYNIDAYFDMIIERGEE